MVIPDRNPSKLLMTGKQIQVGSVGGKAFAVVIECVDSSIRLRDASYAVTPATKAKIS